MLDQFAKLKAQLPTNASAEKLAGFFNNWFIRHVLSSDREYAAYVKKEFPALLGRPPA
jgi:hemerythrin